MSWLQKLHETYEACSKKSEFTEPDQRDGEKEIPALMPVSHTSQQAHICIELDLEGNFKRAELLPPKKQMVIPATEESAGRAGAKVAPHPLIDKVHYIASDYKGRKASVFKGGFEAYKKLLGAWANSEFTHPIVRSVFLYISKGHVVGDLAAQKILLTDEGCNLLTTPPEDVAKCIFNYINADSQTKQYDQGDAVVCWRTIGKDLRDSWSNKELQQCWIRFDAANMCEKSLCMVSANTTAVAKNHPRYIRRPGDGAKLISSNDNDGFTFRGRFITAAEACTVGYEVSHKAHNTLRWLIARQGYRNGDQVVLAWAVRGVALPPPVLWNPAEEPDFYSDVEDEVPAFSTASQETPHRDVGQEFARRLKKVLRGYRKQFSGADGIAVLALDAAGPGRLSVTFYREQIAGEYLDRLERWQQDASWRLPLRGNAEETGSKVKPETRFTPYAPLPETIAKVAYGRHIDEKLLKATLERLLPCIVDGAPISRDLMESCVRRACNRVGFSDKSQGSWEEAIGVACAVYKGFYARTNPVKEYTMGLEGSREDRCYLYGRLLAVAEHMESRALFIAGESRPTSAERLFQRFADHPFSTWLTIRKQLSNYLPRLRQRRSGFLFNMENLLDQITSLFKENDFESKEALDGAFLLGYHCQRYVLRHGDQNESEVTTTVEESQK